MKRLLFFALFLLAGCSTSFYYLGSSWERELPDNLDLGMPCQADQVVNRQGYAVGYSQYLKQPLWVTYRLTKDEAESKLVKRTNDFRSDPGIVGGSANPEDYIRSGYDRGHLAPAADMHWSTNVMSESFFMSNMSPQTPGLNRNTWACAEEFTRDVAIREGSVFVVSGPVVTNQAPRVIGRNKVVVPDAFYKVIYDETPPEKMIAFVMPNDNPNADMWLYATNVVCVEELTGMVFFPVLELEKHLLKMQVNTNEWISINEKDSSTSLTNGVTTVTGGDGGISQSGE